VQGAGFGMQDLVHSRSRGSGLRVYDLGLGVESLGLCAASTGLRQLVVATFAFASPYYAGQRRPTVFVGQQSSDFI